MKTILIIVLVLLLLGGGITIYFVEKVPATPPPKKPATQPAAAPVEQTYNNPLDDPEFDVGDPLNSTSSNPIAAAFMAETNATLTPTDPGFGVTI